MRLLQRLEGTPLSGEQRVRAARVLRKLGAPLEALELMERLPADGPEDWPLRFELCHTLHRQPEAAHCLDQAVAADPHSAILARRAIEFRIAAQDLGAALSISQAVLGHCPADPHLLRLRADLYSRLRPDEADPHIQAAWDSSQTTWWTLLDCWARIGRYDRMDQALAARCAAQPEDPATLSFLGRMALWRGDTETAQTRARQALALDPTHREGHFLLGAAAVLDGRPEDAAGPLTEAIEGNAPPTWLHPDAAWTFRSCMLRTQKEYHAALEAGGTAMFSAQDYNVAAQVARIMAAYYVFKRSGRLDPRHLEIAHQVHDLADDPSAQWDGRTHTFREGMAAVERRLSGNRSSLTTWVDDEGALQPHRVPPYPRNLCRQLQMQIRCRPSEEIFAEFDAMRIHHPRDPTVLTYRGELRVWLGAHEQAAADFEAAIALDPRTTWAWIGWAATQLCRGQLEAALETLAEGIIRVQYEGPTVFVYRGEALRLLGRLEEAATDLAQATQNKPQRLSAWINRTLCAEAGGDPVPAQLLGSALAQTNPGLWSDATRAAPSADQVLQTCLDLMRGNRSSTILTYLTPSGTLRLAMWRPSDVPDALREALGD